MKKIDIEILKKEPKTKLVIQHYQKETPILWLVPKWEIAMGNHVVIKMPITGYETDDIILVGHSGDIRDEDHNPVGTLCIADDDDLVMISLDDLGSMIYNLKVGEFILFDCNEGGDGWGAQKVELFDDQVILIGCCGGGSTRSFDINIDPKEEEVIEFIKVALEDDADDFVYINPIKDKN